jgi:hypothetical protein
MEIVCTASHRKRSNSIDPSGGIVDVGPQMV